MPAKRLAADTKRVADSLPEFAERVGVSVRTLYASVARGEGPPLTKIGNRTARSRKAGDAWLASREQARTTLPRELLENPHALRLAIRAYELSLAEQAEPRDPTLVRDLRAALDRAVADLNASAGAVP